MSTKKIFLLLVTSVLLFFSINMPLHADSSLKDINNHWAKNYIQQLIQRGAVNGNPDGTFLPDDNITRAAFVKILVLSLGYQLEDDKTFADTVNHWGNKYIGTAVREGLIISDEYVNGLFEPDKDITRAEMARMIARALEKNKIPTNISGISLNFTDSNTISEEFRKYIQIASEKGIITGFTDGRFGPNEKATRAHACTMIVRLLNVLETQNNDVIKELLPEDIYSSTNPAVFYLEVYDNSGNVLGTGSGFIIESSGKAVTNFHVIKGASSAKAFLSDGNKIEVKKVINYDKYKDIAILQLDGSDLPAVKIGDSDKIAVGQKVLAISSPRGLENTISDGIISNKQRIIHGQKFIQTTTPISPGSSGGVLLNYFGEAIGITTLYMENGQNLNFAIPINEVKDLLSQTPNPQDLNDIDSEETLSDFKGKVVSVRFFESGDEYIPENEREYSNRFPISTTRYVNWEIKLKYPSAKHHIDINIKAIHYNPDGSYDGEYTLPHCIEENWTESIHTGGWGFPRPALWESGKYKVELYIGDEKIAEEYFEIYDDLNSYSSLNSKITNFEFFESDSYDLEDNIGNINTKFEKSKTRYVFWIIRVEHRAPKYDVNFDITYIYYKSNGTKVGEFKDEFTIGKNETYSVFYGGIGSALPGLWESGKYKVELLVEGEKIAEKSFEIEDNFSLASLDAEVVDLVFFESGKDYTNDEIDYGFMFEEEKSRYVYWRITIDHKFSEDIVGYPIKAIYYKPDGTILTESIGYFLIPSGPTRSYGFGNFGWDEPGNWEKGTYKVELYIKDEKIAEESFDIY